MLGGVGRAASGSNNYGPFRTNTNSGRAVQGGSVSVSVRIHDFAEMDRQVLSQAARSENGPPLPGAAEHAYSTLNSRHRPATAREPLPDNDEDAERAAKDLAVTRYLRKGQAAKAEGKLEVARVWFRLAEKQGSEAATAELGKLNRSVAQRN